MSRGGVSNASDLRIKAIADRTRNIGANSLEPTMTATARSIATAFFMAWSILATAEAGRCAQPGTAVAIDPPCSLDCTATVPSYALIGCIIPFKATATPSNCQGDVTYDWDFGDGSEHSAEQNAFHTYTFGQFTWTLQVSAGDASCLKTGTIDIPLDECGRGCRAQANPLIGRAPLQVSFSVSPISWSCGSDINYSWDFGDGNNAQYKNPVHTYTAPGTYKWHLDVTFGFDSISCSICEASGVITVADYSHCAMVCSAEVPYLGCTTSPTLFSGLSTSFNCPEPPQYQWDFGDGASSTEQNPSHQYSKSGPLYWSLTVSTGGLTCLKKGMIYIYPCCIISCAASVPTKGLVGEEITFSAEADENCSSTIEYYWHFGDDTECNFRQVCSHSYRWEGTFWWYLTVILVGGNGCVKEGQITITRPNAKPGDCNADGTVSIDELQKAINMFLGVTAPACGVDCNGDGQISIGEVQKVINAFLGLAAHC